MEGARAVAEAVALSRPEVICAYPNTPQTHIVEALGAKVKAGTLRRCEFLNVESEGIGWGGWERVCCEGLRGVGCDVMTCDAIGAINIWNDTATLCHSGTRAGPALRRDESGSARPAIQAFRIAEELSVL